LRVKYWQLAQVRVTKLAEDGSLGELYLKAPRQTAPHRKEET